MSLWSNKKLREATRIISGATPKTNVNEYWNGELLWVTPKDLGALQTIEISSTERRITQAGFESCSAQLIPSGSVVMSSRAPIGHLAINTLPVCTNQGCKSFVPSAELDARFLFWTLRALMSDIQHLGDGCTFEEVSKRDLEEFEIPVPPLTEQRRIVARVEALTSRLDQARQARQSALGEAETILTSAVSEEMERAVQSGRSMELGQILTKVQYGTSVKASPEPNGLPVIRMGNIQVGAIKTTDLKYLQLPPLDVERYRLEKGDILINRTNSAALVGKAGLFNIEGDYLFASYLIRLRVDVAVADPEFVNYVINSEEGQAYLRGQGKDAIGQTNINSGQIRKMPIRLPDLPQQRATVAGLNALRGKLEELLPLQREVETELAAFVPALLAKAFRGEL